MCLPKHLLRAGCLDLALRLDHALQLLLKTFQLIVHEILQWPHFTSVRFAGNLGLHLVERLLPDCLLLGQFVDRLLESAREIVASGVKLIVRYLQQRCFQNTFD